MSLNCIIGSDHGGHELKKQLAEYFKGINFINITEVGSTGETCDYPDVAKIVCNEIISGKQTKGILLCGTGIGISIAANKFDGIRCALVYDVYTAKMAKMHNNANIIAIGGRTTNYEIAKEIIDTWLNSDFIGEHHILRLNKITKLEEENKIN